MLTISDYSDVRHLSEKLVDATNRITGLTKAAATARQIREFDGDRRKRALAVAVQAEIVLDSSLSATAAESRGRANPAYAQEMAKLGMELRDAEKTIAEWEAAKCAWESVRSLLSLQRAIAGNL